MGRRWGELERAVGGEVAVSAGARPGCFLLPRAQWGAGG